MSIITIALFTVFIVGQGYLTYKDRHLLPNHMKRLIATYEAKTNAADYYRSLLTPEVARTMSDDKAANLWYMMTRYPNINYRK